jgi:methylase of polypeptide subunit release factors
MNISKINKFINKWKDKGREKQDTHKYWEELIEILLDVKYGRDYVDWEKEVPVPVITTEDGKSTKYIDCYLKESKCLIEQKSHNISLDKKLKQSDGNELNALEQAQMYYNRLKLSDKGRYTIACNFSEFRIFDNELNSQQPVVIMLPDLSRRRNWKYLRKVLLGLENHNDDDRKDAAAKTASGVVKRLYELLKTQYKKEELTRDVLHQMNVFCVRVVFCLYADDSGLFPNEEFQSFLQAFPAKKLQEKFYWLFVSLDKEPQKRAATLDVEIKNFPYVNGGLFKKVVDVPLISEPIKKLLIESAEGLEMPGKGGDLFSWSEISPTNFGCIFESTLDPETQKENGMHYTSPENIHRVIDPLFLNDLRKELDIVLAMPNEEKGEKEIRENCLKAYQTKLAKLRFFDPACGSGNFLTETFKSLRRLEMEAVSEMSDKGFNPCKVSIDKFYGIEINDFAAQVARAALWISDCQMTEEEMERFQVSVPQLPLKSYDHICCGNALTIDWNRIVKPRQLNYIIGNPPFVGASKMSAEQKSETVAILGKGNRMNSVDYVGAWYHKAAAMINGTNIQCAFVSTNSITQGEQVAPLWKKLFDEYKLKISFAWRTFKWENANKQGKQAGVYCVIIGFANKLPRSSKRIIYTPYKDGEVTAKEVSRISPYLIESDNILVEVSNKQLCGHSEMTYGNKPSAKNLIFSEEEKVAFERRYKEISDKCLRRYIGSKDFLHGKPIRYCLWLKEVSPSVYSGNPIIEKRLTAVTKERLESPQANTRRFADTPHLFFSSPQPDTDFMAIPETSSENRQYIPIAYLDKDVRASNSLQIIPNANLYEFGILTSSLHMIWVKTIGGRLKGDYRFTSIAYNTFPWPRVSQEQIELVEKKAQGILNARSNHSECCLADLYQKGRIADVDLLKAHKENDEVVMKLFGFDSEMTEEQIANELLKRYKKMMGTIEKKKRKPQTKSKSKKKKKK